MLKKITLLSLAISSAAGCCHYMPSDVMFSVEGEAPRNTVCELNLLADGAPASPSETIEDKFVAVYYVSFCEKEYTLQAICNGKVVFEDKVTFPSKKTKQPYNIGKLPMNNHKQRRN